MATTVQVRPSVLRWARERAALDPEQLARRVGLIPRRVEEWEKTGELELRHLERLAEKTHTPIGFLFLGEPPRLSLPIADFRGRGDQDPSPDLLETVYSCQQRQAWYRENAVGPDEPALAFVGSVRSNEDAADVAEDIRETIGLSAALRASASSWEDALKDLFDRVEEAGILVMRNGIVGNNTHRPLSVDEFRGFALSDARVPLIFVNAADSKSAQMFTVAHELAHIWRGDSGVSDVSPRSSNRVERFCNQVAAQLLVPLRDFTREWRAKAPAEDQLVRLSRVFKVSALVILIRALEADAITEARFDELYAAEKQRLSEIQRGPGGDFYATQRSRLGRRFTSAVVASALEGSTSYSEAFHLLGVRKQGTFNELARDVGVLP